MKYGSIRFQIYLDCTRALGPDMIFWRYCPLKLSMNAFQDGWGKRQGISKQTKRRAQAIEASERNIRRSQQKSHGSATNNGDLAIPTLPPCINIH